MNHQHSPHEFRFVVDRVEFWTWFVNQLLRNLVFGAKLADQVKRAMCQGVG